MVESQSRTRAAGYMVFTAALGVVGWVFLIAAAFGHVGAAAVVRPDAFSIALFGAVIVAGRSSAVRTAQGQVLALDAIFYIAAAVCLGPVLAGGMVAMALTLDASIRLVLATPEERERGLGWWGGLGYVLFFGGVTGALLTAVGWLFSLESLYTELEKTDLAVLLRLLAAGGVFVAVHYQLQAVRVLLSGGTLRQHLRRVVIPGALAETALTPLAAIIVYVYRPNEPLRFILLGATYVVINLMFNRIYSTTMKLRRRVRDLEVLNATARNLAGSLQTGDVLDAIAKAAMRSLPGASSVSLTRPGEDGDWLTERYVVADRAFRRDRTDEPPDRVSRVLETSGAVLESGADGSFLGVPLSFYGEVEGALAVEGPTPHAFTRDDCRLLESLAAQTSVAMQNAELYALAMVDGLTRLYVRRYFDARLEEEILRGERFGTVFSVVMMDVDDFKALNDTYGHLVGDRALQAVSEVVRRELRGVDTAARYGGEEVAMILPRTSMLEAYNVAERIRTGIEALELRSGMRPVRVTASFGIASYPESGASSREDLVRLADRALYRAKRTGKNRVELFWADESEERPVPLKVVEEPEPGA